MDMQTYRIFGGLLCGIFFPEVAAVNNKVSVSIKVATPLMLSLIIQRKPPPVKLAKISYKHQTLLLHQSIYF